MLAWVVCAQTDPNWSNFLYDTESDTLNLIDFGGECRCLFCEIVSACVCFRSLRWQAGRFDACVTPCAGIGSGADVRRLLLLQLCSPRQGCGPRVPISLHLVSCLCARMLHACLQRSGSRRLPLPPRTVTTHLCAEHCLLICLQGSTQAGLTSFRSAACCCCMFALRRRTAIGKVSDEMR